METPETRAKLASAIRDLQSKGDTATIDRLVRAYKAKYKPQSDADSLTGSGVGSLPVIKQATQFGAGVGSAIGGAGLNLGKAFLKASNVAGNLMGAPRDQYNPAIEKLDQINSEIFQKPAQKELSTTGGKIGSVVGEVAPYVATGGTTSAITNAMTAPIKGFAGAGLARTLAGAGTEALSNAGLTYALSGGDTQQAKNSALTAGVLKGIFSGANELAKATGLPSKLMGGIYKADKKEIAKTRRLLLRFLPVQHL